MKRLQRLENNLKILSLTLRFLTLVYFLNWIFFSQIPYFAALHNECGPNKLCVFHNSFIILFDYKRNSIVFFLQKNKSWYFVQLYFVTTARIRTLFSCSQKHLINICIPNHVIIIIHVFCVWSLSSFSSYPSLSSLNPYLTSSCFLIPSIIAGRGWWSHLSSLFGAEIYADITSVMEKEEAWSAFPSISQSLTPSLSLEEQPHRRVLASTTNELDYIGSLFGLVW